MYMCSTPFGIKGFCTKTSLTANTLVNKCSTPFGIKGFCTQGQWRLLGAGD